MTQREIKALQMEITELRKQVAALAVAMATSRPPVYVQPYVTPQPYIQPWTPWTPGITYCGDTPQVSNSGVSVTLSDNAQGTFLPKSP